MRTIVINAMRLQDRETAHAYLQKRLKSPEYHGSNLDALYDVVSALGNETRILILHSRKVNDYGTKVLATLEDAAEANENLRIFEL